MTAFAEGKDIESRSVGASEWIAAARPEWRGASYRIKPPEPAEAWLYPGLVDAWIGKPPTPNDIIEHHLRKFREVTDE